MCECREVCEEFVYGGCGGNDNNRFATKSVCERHCIRSSSVLTSSRGNRTHGQDGGHRRTRCPLHGCRRPCEFGLQRDENNCTICACAPNPAASTECEQIECPDVHCPRGFQLDVNGCTTCDCRPSVQHRRPERSVACPPPCKGRLGCQYGQKRDENGCTLCQCQTMEEMCGQSQCAESCPNGFKVDSRGCEMCECREVRNYTRHSGRHEGHHGSHGSRHEGRQGSHEGHHGSHEGRHRSHEGRQSGGHHGGGSHHGRRATTASPGKPAQLPAGGTTTVCPVLRCSLRCRSGYAKDSFGCNICACGSSSRDRSSTGYPSRRSWSSRTTTPPPGLLSCDNRPMCMMYCENGFQKGADGCDVCQCA